MADLNLHWQNTVPVGGEVLTEVVGSQIVVEGWAPGDPPPPHTTSGTATWTGPIPAEIDWTYSDTLTLQDVRVTCPPCPPATGAGRATYQAGSTRVEVEWSYNDGVLTITDADVTLLAGVD